MSAHDEARLGRLADMLWDARALGRPCPAPTSLEAEFSLGDAYRVSLLNHRRRLELGVRAVGAKIGLTSAAVQRQLGVDQPDFGYLCSDMLVADGGVLPRGALLQGRVEGEVAFTLKSDLRGPGVGAAEVAAATLHVSAAIEVIDSRVEGWRIKIEDTVADNASSAAFVLSTTPRPLSAVDLPAAAMTLWKNGAVASTGVGTACMGDPALAVAWLANTFGALGETLRAGDIVLSGAYGPVVPFGPGDRCAVEISGLGRASCSCAP